MRHLNKANEKDYITFDSDENSNNYNKYEDFEQVEKKLNEILAKNKGSYSDIPIRISLYSHNCIDGIIIDLPGFPDKGELLKKLLKMKQKYFM